jgi:hypothetical protein
LLEKKHPLIYFSPLFFFHQRSYEKKMDDSYEDGSLSEEDTQVALTMIYYVVIVCLTLGTLFLAAWIDNSLSRSFTTVLVNENKEQEVGKESRTLSIQEEDLVVV